MGLSENIVCVGELENAYRILVGRPNGRDLEEL
jgi:hypothetical protein